MWLPNKCQKDGYSLALAGAEPIDVSDHMSGNRPNIDVDLSARELLSCGDVDEK
jgi:hypothetical protein